LRRVQVDDQRIFHSRLHWEVGRLPACFMSSSRGTTLLGFAGPPTRLPTRIWRVPTYRLDWVVLGHSRAARWHSWVAVGREWRHHPALHSQECLHSLHPRELLGSLVWDRVSHQWEIMRRPLAAASPTPMESACWRTVCRV